MTAEGEGSSAEDLVPAMALSELARLSGRLQAGDRLATISESFSQLDEHLGPGAFVEDPAPDFESSTQVPSSVVEAQGLHGLLGGSAAPDHCGGLVSDRRRLGPVMRQLSEDGARLRIGLLECRGHVAVEASPPDPRQGLVQRASYQRV